MPLIGRGIGQDTDLVIVDVQLAADIFDDDAVAVGVVDDVVKRREAAELRHVLGPHDDLRNRRADFLDIGEIAEHPCAECEIGEGLVLLADGDRLIFRFAGKIERAEAEAGFIEAVGRDRLAHRVHVDIAVFAGPGDARAAIRRRRCRLEAAWRDDHHGFQVELELHRPDGERRAVLGDDAHVGACKDGRKGEQPGGSTDDSGADHEPLPLAEAEIGSGCEAGKAICSPAADSP